MKRTLIALIALFGLGLGLTLPQIVKAAPPDTDAKVIKVIERPGHFETPSNIYNIPAGEYQFSVHNRSGKDAGFVLIRKGQKPLAIGIKNGQKGTLKTKLEPGDYEYFCPIIPTPKYSFTVK